MSEKLLLLAAFVISMLLMAGNHKRKRNKIIFFGDSITSQGSRPGGYITHILRLLKEADLEYKYDLINAGADGNTVADLLARVDKDILAEGADIVVVFIGTNDVLKKISGGGTSETEFEVAYEAVIKKLDAATIKIILCTPSVIGERINLTNEQDNDLENYSEIIRNLSSKYELPLADVRKAFLAYNFKNNVDNNDQSILTIDSVHLSPEGNQLAAAEIWKALQQVMQQ